MQTDQASNLGGLAFKRLGRFFCCRRNILKILFTRFAFTAGCVLLVATFANAQNQDSAAKQSFCSSAAHATGGQMQNVAQLWRLQRMRRESRILT